MPILSDRILARSRARWRKRIHNVLMSVRIRMAAASVVFIPGYEANKEYRTVEFNGFPCSFYEVLSSKLNRVFRSRLESLDVPAGVLDKTEWLVEYIPNNYEYLVCTGIVDAPDSATVLTDAGNDFFALGVRDALLNALPGAKIVNDTDGSEGYVSVVAQHALTVAALSGGMDNQFQIGDAYSVYNVCDLQEGDQVLIRNKWRTVLMVIPDSENLQQTALMSD